MTEDGAKQSPPSAKDRSVNWRRRAVLWPLAFVGGFAAAVAAGVVLHANRPMRVFANVCLDPNAFQIELVRPFVHKLNHMYVAAVGNDTWNTPRFLKHPLLGNMRLGPADTDDAPQQSTAVVCEDERPLGPPHSSEADITHIGQGRYAHYQGSGGR